MATRTQTDNLVIEYFFVDGDTRKQTIPNIDRNTATAEALSNLNAYLQENNLIIGDKTGATFGRIISAKAVTKAVFNLDI